jgi:hypothetical protein
MEQLGERDRVPVRIDTFTRPTPFAYPLSGRSLGPAMNPSSDMDM